LKSILVDFFTRLRIALPIFEGKVKKNTNNKSEDSLFFEKRTVPFRGMQMRWFEISLLLEKLKTKREKNERVSKVTIDFLIEDQKSPFCLHPSPKRLVSNLVSQTFSKMKIGSCWLRGSQVYLRNVLSGSSWLEWVHKIYPKEKCNTEATHINTFSCVTVSSSKNKECIAKYFPAYYKMYLKHTLSHFSTGDVCLLNQGILKEDVSLYHWPPVWLVWISLFCT